MSVDIFDSDKQFLELKPLTGLQRKSIDVESYIYIYIYIYKFIYLCIVITEYEFIFLTSLSEEHVN